MGKYNTSIPSALEHQCLRAKEAICTLYQISISHGKGISMSCYAWFNTSVERPINQGDLLLQILVDLEFILFFSST